MVHVCRNDMIQNLVSVRETPKTSRKTINLKFIHECGHFSLFLLLSGQWWDLAESSTLWYLERCLHAFHIFCQLRICIYSCKCFCSKSLLRETRVEWVCFSGVQMKKAGHSALTFTSFHDWSDRSRSDSLARLRWNSSDRRVHKDRSRAQQQARSSQPTSTMFHLLLVAVVLLGAYVLLTRTLFKRAKCKGNAAMSGKTVIITGETGIKRSVYQTDCWWHSIKNEVWKVSTNSCVAAVCAAFSEFPLIGFFTSS